ncbi:hypothetical protein K488DRAFT_43652, partial [Vararia minispora EC-137]
MSSGKFLEQHLISLDEELRLVETARVSLRGCRNAFIPVSRLPPEILTRIFLELALISPPKHAHSPSVSSRKHESLGWIVVTQVCARWRHVACACSSLWTLIDFELGEAWTDEMLWRAGSASLHIK